MVYIFPGTFYINLYTKKCCHGNFINTVSTNYIYIYLSLYTKCTFSIFVDLTKAFYTVYRLLLNAKALNFYGIHDVSDKWYLCNRSQFVKIHECSSNILNVSCGV